MKKKMENEMETGFFGVVLQSYWGYIGRKWKLYGL